VIRHGREVATEQSRHVRRGFQLPNKRGHRQERAAGEAAAALRDATVLIG
jgi:hypothetical protein